MKNEIIDGIKEWLGGVVLVTLVGLLVWLYMEATPDQLSGEADLLHEEAMEGLE